jgi:hypothetical protein
MTGVGLLYPNDLAISKAVSPLTSRCSPNSISQPAPNRITAAEERIAAPPAPAQERFVALPTD